MGWGRVSNGYMYPQRNQHLNFWTLSQRRYRRKGMKHLPYYQSPIQKALPTGTIISCSCSSGFMSNTSTLMAKIRTDIQQHRCCCEDRQFVSCLMRFTNKRKLKMNSQSRTVDMTSYVIKDRQHGSKSRGGFKTGKKIISPVEKSGKQSLVPCKIRVKWKNNYWSRTACTIVNNPWPNCK